MDSRAAVHGDGRRRGIELHQRSRPGEVPSGILPSPGRQSKEETVTTVPVRMLSKSPLLC